MNFSPTELQLCKAWAQEHSEEDDPLDVFHWKLLEIGLEKSERSASYHARVVAEIGIDKDNLSTQFYETNEAAPNGDEDIAF